MKKFVSFYLQLLLLVLWIGPSPQAFSQNNFWESTNGPINESIDALTIGSNDEIFAGNDGGGLFSSTDHGNSWTELHLGNKKVLSVGFSNAGGVFVGCRGGICRSTDDGASWSCTDTLSFTYDFAVKPNGDIFAIDFGRGLFRSTNNGLQWIKTGFPSGYYSTVKLNSLGFLYVGGLSLKSSTDGGETWIGNWNITGKPLAISPNDYIFSAAGDSLVRSTDNGASWARADAGISGTRVLTLAINSAGHIFAGTSGEGVFRSTNNGDAWMAINSGLTRSTVSTLVVDGNGFVYAGTDSGGIFRSLQSTTEMSNGAGSTPPSFTLAQNYPNPFNPKTVIRYSLSVTSYVSLIVIDIMGREVATVVDEIKRPGRYDASWNAGNVTNGVYFYKLSAGNFSEVKKMVFMK